MKQNLLSKKIFLLLLFFPLVIFAQESITGTIKEASSGAPLPGVNVVVKGANNGTTSDFDGIFKLDVPSLIVTLVVSSVGSSEQEVEVVSNNAGTISLNDGVSLDEVVVVGNRTKPRSFLTSSINGRNINQYFCRYYL